VLGHARRLGLPVLPGFVIPAQRSAGALKLAADAYAGGGAGAARLAAMDAPLEDAFVAELEARAASLASSLVVRSSSPLEGEGRWAGAFTSYVGIAPHQIGTAVRGCWASVYSRDAIERCEHERIDVASLRLAVLVQPAIEFEAGGAARVDDDGVVHVAATRGSPAALMTGWESGEEIAVDPRSSLPAQGSRVIGGEGLIAIAALARRVRTLLGDDTIEWGFAPGFGVLLLQAKRTAASRPPARAVPAPASGGPAALAAIRLARLVRRFPGWLGEEVVLPWAILVAEAALPDGAPPAGMPAEEARREARALGLRLCARAWQLPAEEAFRAGLQAVEAVRTGVADAALMQRIRRGADVDAKAVARLVGLLRTAERRDGRGRIAPARDRWEPFLFATLQAYGERRPAAPVVAGTGAGRARFVETPAAAPDEHDRKVLVIPRPLPSFAPLLWNAAGLVSIAGGAGAHLMEIARSLAVPAVMRCRLDDLVAQGADSFLLGVDGHQGSVSVLPLRG
jgi:phosphohistidine swiveling domain-containing protein